MKRKIIENLTNFVNYENKYSELELKKIRYGIEGIYLTITKLIIIFLLAYILGIFKDTLIILLLFNVVRYFGFGFHAKESYQCLIFSICCFILLPIFFIKFSLSLQTNLIIAILCICYYAIYAPSDTVKRPLTNRKKRLIRKFLTVLIGILYTLIMIIINNSHISSLIISSLIIEAIIISPITYKIFGQPYNNYKKLDLA